MFNYYIIFDLHGNRQGDRLFRADGDWTMAERWDAKPGKWTALADIDWLFRKVNTHPDTMLSRVTLKRAQDFQKRPV